MITFMYLHLQELGPTIFKLVLAFDVRTKILVILVESLVSTIPPLGACFQLSIHFTLPQKLFQFKPLYTAYFRHHTPLSCQK